MPSRILKESICTSDSINQLTADEECLFYRLIVQCDDYGCWDGRVAIIRARCYPLRVSTVTEKQVAAMLAGLVKAGLVQLYEADGKPYLYLTGWPKHQQIRAQRRKYPQPPVVTSTATSLQADDCNGKQVITDSLVIQSNPIQSYAHADLKSDAGTAPSGAGVSRLGNEQRGLLEAEFCRLTGIGPPEPTTAAQKRQTGTMWWEPLRRMAGLVDNDVGRTEELMGEAWERLKDQVTVSSPKSLVNTATAIAGEWHRNNGHSSTPQVAF